MTFTTSSEGTQPSTETTNRHTHTLMPGHVGVITFTCTFLVSAIGGMQALVSHRAQTLTQVLCGLPHKDILYSNSHMHTDMYSNTDTLLHCYQHRDQ